MGKKRIHRKPVALTFADTSNQPSDQGAAEPEPEPEPEAGGCSSSSLHAQEGAQQGNVVGRERIDKDDDDEVECMGMVSSSTASSEYRKGRPSKRELMRRQQEQDESRIQQQEEEDLLRAIELSRLEMQGSSSFPNSTSDNVVSNASGSGKRVVLADRGIPVANSACDSGASASKTEGPEGPSVVGHRAVPNGRERTVSGESEEIPAEDRDGDEADVYDVDSRDSNVDLEADSRAIDGDGNEDDDDDGESSVSSSILESEDEGISAGQQQRSQCTQSSHSTKQSLRKAIVKVTPWQGQDGISQDIFGEAAEMSPELFVYQEPSDGDEEEENGASLHPVRIQPVSSCTREEEQDDDVEDEDFQPRATLESRKTRLSLRKRKREGDEECVPSRAPGNRKKNRRLGPDLDEEEDEENDAGFDIEVDVEEDGEDDEGSEGPPQEAGFIDFPKRFEEEPGVPLIDCRKSNHASPFLTPPGVPPSAYTPVILRLLQQYKLRLLQVQAQQRRRLELGKPVFTGPNIKDTIVYKRRGQVFQWLSSDEEEEEGEDEGNQGRSHGEVVGDMTRVNSKSQAAVRTYLGHRNRIPLKDVQCSSASSASTSASASASACADASTIHDKVQSEPVTAVLRPNVVRPNTTRVMDNIENAGTSGRLQDSRSFNSRPEVSSSKSLVRKVLPLRKSQTLYSPRANSWVSKAEMVGTRGTNQQVLTGSDDSDTDIELISENANARTTPTASVSPRRATPSEFQASSSLSSPVFYGRMRDNARRGQQVRQVGHCSPRTAHSREQMESPQPSSPRLEPRTEPSIAVETPIAEGTSGVSSTVPDNESRYATPRVVSSQEPGTRSQEPSTSEHRNTSAADTNTSVESRNVSAPPSGANADSNSSEAKACPSSSTNQAEQVNDTNRRVNVSSHNDLFISYEEQRMMYYRQRMKRTTREEGNGFPDVDSSNVNGGSEAGRDGSDDEGLPAIGILSQSPAAAGSGSDIGQGIRGSTSQGDDEVGGNELGQRPSEASGSNEAVEQGAPDALLEIPDDEAVSVGAGPSLADVEDGVDGGDKQNEEQDPNDEEHREAMTTRRGPRQDDDNEEEAHVQNDRLMNNNIDEVEGDGEGEGEGIQCPLCGVPYPINVIEVHASACEGPVNNEAPPPRENGRRETAQDRDSRTVSRPVVANRGSSDEEDDDATEQEVSVLDTGQPARRLAMRKRSFPSSGGTSDEVNSSAGSMTHFDQAVMDMVRNNEIVIDQPANKRAKLQTNQRVEDVDDDDDIEGETEKCFICNKFIPKSLYPDHVQNELDRMEAENSLAAGGSSTPLHNDEPPARKVTRRMAANAEQAATDNAASSAAASSLTTRRQMSLAERGGASAVGAGTESAPRGGTRGSFDGDRERGGGGRNQRT